MKLPRSDIYNVETYTDRELLDILELDEPSDRVLEAKILSMVNKYTRMVGNTSAELLSQFFVDIYSRFFDVPEETEGFQSSIQLNNPAESGNTYAKEEPVPTTMDTTNEFANVSINSKDTSMVDVCGNTVKKYTTPQITRTYNTNKMSRGELDISKNDRDADSTQLTKPIDYTKDTINPILKQTIKRVISIDSQYRDNKNSSSTEFTFNLSEPLKDVLSLKLYSVQIPFTWYTINSSFGGNFFYIKGDTEGINNGDHDYQIKIGSGNYSTTGLQQAIQSSIDGLKSTYLDVSFGTTGIAYNSSSVLMKLTIDMKEAFGETNYYIEFPNWSSPLNPIGRLDTLSGYMGFNNTVYNCGSIYSMRELSQIITTTAIYVITALNNQIDIITYVGATPTDLYDASSSIQTYSIRLTPNTYSSLDSLLTEINLQMTSASFLDSAHSGIRKVDITNSAQQNANFSYIQMDVKLTRKELKNLDNIKTVVVFPTDTNIWIGVNSLFKFKTAINEVSNIESETPILQSRYLIKNTLTEKTQLRFRCITPEYINSANDFVVELAQSPNLAGYTFDEYLDEVNAAIHRVNATYSYNPIYISDSIGTVLRKSNQNLELRLFVRKLFTKANYTITFQGIDIVNLFAFTDIQSALNVVRDTSNHIVSITWPLSTVSAFTSTLITQAFNIPIGNQIIITPVIQYSVNGTMYPLPYVFTVGNNTRVFDDASEFVAFMSTKITTFLDGQNANPFLSETSRTTIVVDDNNASFVLTFNITKILSISDYKLELYSNQLDTGSTVQNTWNAYLGFTGSVPTNANQPIQEYTNLGSSILNTILISDNLITLTERNNYFYIKPYPDTNGLATSNGLYTIKLTLPAGVYSIDDVYVSINALLANNAVTNGSVVYKTDRKTTMFRLNINKVFRTEDYRIVFYDPYSFVSCYSGASRKGNKSVQNATWDTTIGWILGFRENIIYYLRDYAYDSTPDGNSQYYEDAERHRCVLISDTTVSTNLYNYFLIVLDDYTQNHLNDGLVTITTQETAIDVEKYTYVCDPYSTSGNSMIAVPASKAHDGSYKNMTQRELYTFNQKILSNKVKEKSYSKGPFVKDIFGIIPIKTAGLSTGSTYVEFGGTLQNQERMYFGPVNIHRMTIRLMNDRGDLVDLNNSNWSFSLVCEQLYRSKLT